MAHPRHPPIPDVAKITDLGRAGGEAADVAITRGGGDNTLTDSAIMLFLFDNIVQFARILLVL